MAETKYSAPAVARALEIIELLATTEVDLTVTAIANSLDVSVNSAFRILKEMEKKHYVQKSATDNSYRLTSKLYYLGKRAAEDVTLLQEVEPAMNALSLASGETILLGSLTENLNTLVMKQIPATHSIKFLSQEGGVYDSYCSAMGKCLLAFLPEHMAAEYIAVTEFEAKTPTTIVDKEAFQQEMVEIRSRGYAMDQEESVKGLVCIAYPILSAGGKVEGALCISGIGFRMTQGKIAYYKELIQKEVAGISSRLCNFT